MKWSFNIFKQLEKQLKKAGIRAATDGRNEKIGKKIREAELERVSYMLVVGEKEMESGSAALRKQGKGDLGVLTVAEIIAQLKHEITERLSGE